MLCLLQLHLTAVVQRVPYCMRFPGKGRTWVLAQDSENPFGYPHPFHGHCGEAGQLFPTLLSRTTHVLAAEEYLRQNSNDRSHSQ